MKAALQRETRTDGPKTYVSPQVNIFETKDGYVLEAEMPGVNKEGLEITLEGTGCPDTQPAEIRAGKPQENQRRLSGPRSRAVWTDAGGAPDFRARPPRK